MYETPQTKVKRPCSKNVSAVTIIDGDQSVKTWELNSFGKNPVTFGRDESNDITLTSGFVSRFHGGFVWENGQIFVYDAESTNGLVVNDRPLVHTAGQEESGLYPLKDGDILRIDNAKNNRSSKLGVVMVVGNSGTGSAWRRHSLLQSARTVIGRREDCDLVISSLKVSRRHAEVILREDGQYSIRDLDSFNGVFVNGRRVDGECILEEKDVIYVADSFVLFTGGMLLYRTETEGTRVVMEHVSRVVRGKGGEKTILNDVSLTVEPNELVAVIGGSGAGKSTVMNAMSGFEQATSGRVLLNSVDLYSNYALLKNMLGYVPQQDIIYENLSLRRMLEFSAKMRMPDDVSPRERANRIQEILQMVDLTEHQNKLIRSLSGGQKKRASIAVELLADPGLFFLDEPTSGLDPGTEKNLMQTLRGLAKEKGKTVVMVTHTTQNLHLCDKILFMGKGGRVCFYGTPQACLTFFGVSDLTEIYNKVTTETETEQWAQKFLRENGDDVSRSGAAPAQAQPQPRRSFWKQWGILSRRYLELVVNDRQRLLMLFLQPFLIAVLLILVADDEVFKVYSITKSILFAMSCAGIWMGLFNSIQEICKERVILKREYMANLSLGAYVSSKFAIQLLMGVIQAAIVTGMVLLFVGQPEEGTILPPGMEMFATMLLTICASSAVGLCVSAVSKNGDKAMTVAPFLLIIQLLFSGLLFELKSATEVLSYFTVSRWSVQALGTTANMNSLEKVVLPGTVREAEKVYDFTAGHMANMWMILLLFAVVCFVLSIVLLRSVERDSR